MRFRDYLRERETKAPFFIAVAHRCILALIAIAIAVGMIDLAHAGKSPYDWAFVRLDYVKKERVEQLNAFCDRIHALALKAAGDPLVISCFDINMQYSKSVNSGLVPEALTDRVYELRDNFNSYYIENYFSFFDILFVNMDGEVFYTIRKESDRGNNLFEGDPAPSALARCLREIPESEAFVDFHDYGPSSEPAAFFIEPVRRDDDVQIGWIILQCAINKVNTLFAWTEDLGQTGETFLVNQEGYMLTESNFEGSSTILSKRLDDRNIKAKFSDGKGHRVVTDYRGCTALSSFQVVEFLGTKWLVVAKMDRDEVVTQHYSQYRRYYADKLIDHLKESPTSHLHEPPASYEGTTLRVDMDEFLKADDSERLHTFGVSTCTAVVVAYPERLAYLAHISPKDKIYGSDDTNLLGQMIKKIKYFDIYRCERHRIKFVIAATHLNSVLPIVDKIVEEGFLLSQIRVLYNPSAASAAVTYDYSDDFLNVSWRMDGGHDGKHCHLMDDAVSISEIIRESMDTEEGANDVAVLEGTMSIVKDGGRTGAVRASSSD